MSEKVKKEKKKLNKYEKWFRSMHRFQRIMMQPLFMPVKKYGHTQPFNDRNYIIVGNHKSVMDVVPAALATDNPVHFMAKKELFEKGIGKWFTAKCRCIPVNRDGNDVRALMSAIKYLKNGESVVIFPEGTRNKTEDIFLPFKSGAAALSIKTKTPIIPMIQVKKFKAFRKVHVLYGEPFEFSEFYDKKLTDEDIAECDERLRQIMLDMYHELEEILSKKKKKQK